MIQGVVEIPRQDTAIVGHSPNPGPEKQVRVRQTSGDDVKRATSNSDAVRILLIDDHPIVRAGVRMLLEKKPGYTVVAEAECKQQAIDAAGRERPDIILLDVGLGAESGLDFLAELIKVTENQSRVLLLTASCDTETHARAVRIGALGVVTKERAPEVLLTAIDKVHNGEAWLERTVVATALTGIWQGGAEQDPVVEKIASLTPRENDVIALIGEGLKNQQIADRLFLSEATVRRHLGSIFLKLEVSDRLDLVVFAFQHGLVKPLR